MCVTSDFKNTHKYLSVGGGRGGVDERLAWCINVALTSAKLTQSGSNSSCGGKPVSCQSLIQGWMCTTTTTATTASHYLNPETSNSEKNFNLIDFVLLIGKERIFATGFYWTKTASFLYRPLCLSFFFLVQLQIVYRAEREKNVLIHLCVVSLLLGTFSFFLCKPALCKCVFCLTVRVLQ